MICSNLNEGCIMGFPVRRYWLSSRKGEGIQCDADGVFVGSVPLLKRSNGSWSPRDNAELSEQLSETYGLPVDFVAKTGALTAIAGALNEGDIARAQLIGLHLQLPEPMPLAKNVSSQSAVDTLVVLLKLAGVLKINNRHYPAGTPDHKGGQFAPKNSDTSSDQNQADDPTNNLGPFDDGRQTPRPSSASASEATGENLTGESAEGIAEAETRAATRAEIKAAVRAVAMSEERSALRKATRELFRKAAFEALKKIGSKLVLSEIPIVGLVADLSTVYDVYRFVREFAELRTEIKPATRFVNEGTHTLSDLRVSPDSLTFNNYDAFVKTWGETKLEIELEKRFGPAGDGMNFGLLPPGCCYRNLVRHCTIAMSSNGRPFKKAKLHGFDDNSRPLAKNRAG